MQTVPTDAEIRAHPAFPLVVRAAQTSLRMSWAGLPFVVAVAIYAVIDQVAWPIAIVAGLGLLSVAAQLYGFRQGRQPAAQISADKETQARVWKLASSDAKPRLFRRVSGL